MKWDMVVLCRHVSPKGLRARSSGLEEKKREFEERIKEAEEEDHEDPLREWIR